MPKNVPRSDFKKMKFLNLSINIILCKKIKNKYFV